MDGRQKSKVDGPQSTDHRPQITVNVGQRFANTMHVNGCSTSYLVLSTSYFFLHKLALFFNECPYKL